MLIERMMHRYASYFDIMRTLQCSMVDNSSSPARRYHHRNARRTHRSEAVMIPNAATPAA